MAASNLKLNVVMRCAACGEPLAEGGAPEACPHCGFGFGDAEPVAVTPATPAAGAATDSEPAFPRRFGEYELLGEIAQGGMGVVYRARQPRLNRIVALKMILLGRHATRADIKRFHQEAEAASNLVHPNIIPIYEVGEIEGQHYFTMHFVEGGNFDERAKDLRADPRRLAKLMAKVARAIHFAHERGILHRDLKPGNILLDADGQPVVTDFGLAKKFRESSDVTQAGIIIGSPNYMSPEQAGGHAEVTTASDVYSLGALLFFLLAGRAPFESDSPMETVNRLLHDDAPSPMAFNPGLDRDLGTICLKCLEKSPEARYRSAEEFADDLERWVRREPIAARPATRLERLVKWSRRHPAWAALTLVSVIAAGALIWMDREGRANLAAQRDIAVRQEQEAQKQRALAVTAAEISRANLVRLQLGTGARLLTEGDAPGALLWYVEALKQDAGRGPREENHRIRVASLLRRSPQLLSVWTNLVFPVAVAESPGGGQVLVNSRKQVWHWDLAQAGSGGGSWMFPDGARRTAISPDGKLVAAVFAASEVVCFGADGREQMRWQNLPALPQRIEFSPDGARLLAVCDGGSAEAGWQVLIYDVAANAPIGKPLPHAGRVDEASFSLDGSRVITQSADQQLRVWNLAAGRIETTIAGRSKVNDYALDPRGRWLAVAGQNRLAQVWDLATGEAMGAPLVHNFPVSLVRFSPDGRRLATANVNGSVRVWDTATSEPVTPNFHQSAALVRLEFSPDGRRLLMATERLVRIADLARDSWPTIPLQSQENLLHAGFAAQGRGVLAITRGRTAFLWALPQGDAQPELELQHGGPLNAIGFGPRGRILVTAGDRSAKYWNAGDGRMVSDFGNGRGIHSVLFDPAGRRLMTLAGKGAGGQSAWVWTMPEGKLAGRTLGQLSFPVFSREGRLLASVGPGNAVQVWNPAQSRSLKQLSMPPGEQPYLLAFDAAGNRLAVATVHGGSTRLRVWDWSVGRPVAPAIESEERITRLEFQPRGELLLTAGTGRRVGLWNWRTGIQSPARLQHAGEISYALFSPDGQRVITTSVDGTARVWEVASGQPVTPLLEHAGRINFASVSQDGTRVLTASLDGTARVWDAETGDMIAAPLRHGEEVVQALFSPEGHRVVTASQDGEVKIWNLAPTTLPVGTLADLAELLAGREVDQTGSPAPIGLGRSLRVWRELTGAQPDLFVPTGDAQEDWHRREAALCEEQRDWFGAAFHLGQCAVLKPDDAALARRLKLALAQLNGGTARP